jgi:tetraacyldisaccharide 4'-kinase
MKQARLLLLPFSFIYGFILVLRNWFFDIGIFKTTSVGVPILSIGNLSAGGTGKTPIVEMFVEIISTKKEVAVVSRGYGRTSKGTIVVSDGTGNPAPVEISGDEPSQLARKYPRLLVLVDEKRVRGAQKAVELGAEIILLDDGFQHRYLHRDLNIVVLTMVEILKGDWLLPAGNRREMMSSLKRSDLIIVSRCNEPMDCRQAAQVLKPLKKPILGVKTKLKSLTRISTDELVGAESFSRRKGIAVSGIGNPESFEQVLARAHINIGEHLVFEDHHWFSEGDVQRMIEVKKQVQADFLVTTEKDAARLRNRFGNVLESESMVVAIIQQEIIDGKENLDVLLQQALR